MNSRCQAQAFAPHFTRDFLAARRLWEYEDDISGTLDSAKVGGAGNNVGGRRCRDFGAMVVFVNDYSAGVQRW